MATEENKHIARILMDDLFCETAYSFYAPDYRFGHMVDYEGAPIRGKAASDDAVNDRRRSMSFFEQNKMTGEALKAVYPDGNTRALKSITGEGDRVVCEYLTHGGRNVFRRDTEHNFHSVKIFDFHKGKVIAVREYTDTAYLMSFGSEIAEFTKAFLNGRAGAGAAERFAWGKSWLLKNTNMELGQPATFADDNRIDENRALVTAMLTDWGSPEMLSKLSDEVMVSNEVDLVNTPTLGRSLHGKEEVATACGREMDIFPQGLSREIISVTAEENRVAVEARLRGTSTLRPDKPFETQILTIFFVRAGKVFRIRQYVDSAYWQSYAPQMVDHILGTEPALSTAPA